LTLQVPVDEVSVIFHATDAAGATINDLKLEELHIRDNEDSRNPLLALYLLQDHPIRAGLLLDTSESMTANLAGSRASALEYAQRLFRGQLDQAIVMGFGYSWKILQPWTSDVTALTAGIRSVAAGKENPLGGTALFDAVYRTCLYDFGKSEDVATGNFILIFSDGEDNSSRTSLENAVDVCQRAHTAIYAFRPELPRGEVSSGPKNLSELTSQTGGRVFHLNASAPEIEKNLGTMESDVRNQYHLVYKPAALKHDGSFHRIEITGPDRVESIAAPAGYYAPAH